MTATTSPAEIRPYVWKDQYGYWFVRVQGYEPELAYKTLGIALVARGIAEPGERIEIDAPTDEGGGLYVFKTTGMHLLGRTGRRMVRAGDHVYILHANSSFHDIQVGSVVRVMNTSPHRRTNSPEDLRVWCEGPAAWSDDDPAEVTEDWIYPGEYEISDLALTPFTLDEDDDY
jgi:hypothetical protein